MVGPLGAELVSQEFRGRLLNDPNLTEEFLNEFPPGTPWTLLIEWDDDQEPSELSEGLSAWMLSKFELTLGGEGGKFRTRSTDNLTFTMTAFASNNIIQFRAGSGPADFSNSALAGYDLHLVTLNFVRNQSSPGDLPLDRAPSQIDLSEWQLALSDLKIYYNPQSFPFIKGGISDIPPVAVETGVLAMSVGDKQLLDSRSTVNVGKARRGKSKSRRLTVQNTGLGSLEGIRGKILGKARQDFRIRGSVRKLGSSETKSVRLIFKPRKLGNRRASLRVTSNDGNSPFDLKLRGRGVK